MEIVIIEDRQQLMGANGQSFGPENTAVPADVRLANLHLVLHDPDMKESAAELAKHVDLNWGRVIERSDTRRSERDRSECFSDAKLKGLGGAGCVDIVAAIFSDVL